MVDHTITRSEIKEIHLTDLPQITTAPNDYLKNMCYGMINLKVGDIKIPQTIINVSASFLSWNVFWVY